MISRVALVPAAGHSRRLAPLPCSKEILPIGYRETADGELRPKVAGHWLLEQVRRAGATRAWIVLRDGKWDIPAYFGDGAVVGLPIAYLVTRATPGPAYTLDLAYPFVRDALVLFGFPDILVSPEDPYTRLIERQAATGADLVLGMFEAHDPRRLDLVDADDSGRVRALELPPHAADRGATWIVAVWTPAFSDFLHQYVSSRPTPETEISVGHVLREAIVAGLPTQAVAFPDGSYLDIGTPEDLARAMARHAPRSR